MLNKYKFSVSDADLNITIPLTMDNNSENHDNKETFIENEIQKSINPIVSYEKESYSPVSPYKLIYKFYDTSYSASFSKAGFTDENFETKNNFKKSLFLLEFYDNPSKKNNMIFNTTLNVSPNPLHGKGCDIETKVVKDISGDIFKFKTKNVISSSFTISDVRNELFLLFYKRDIKPEAGKNYISIYMKSMFLNAKTGKAHYFINSDNDTVIKSTDLSESLYYYEIRFFDNHTYGFYKNNLLMGNIELREVITQ